MKPRIISGPRILLASLALSLAACSDCKNEEEAPPVVPESAQEGSGFDPFGNAQAAVEVEAVPERPGCVRLCRVLMSRGAKLESPELTSTVPPLPLFADPP